MSENETIFPTLYLVFTKMNINVKIKITDNLNKKLQIIRKVVFMKAFSLKIKIALSSALIFLVGFVLVLLVTFNVAKKIFQRL